MRLLTDTNVLLYSIAEPGRLAEATREILVDPDNDVVFSVVNIWEIGIKAGKRLADFRHDAAEIRNLLFANGWTELDVTGLHAVAASALPLLHNDPFDRMLIAQATVEGVTLLTSDRIVARYPGPVRLV